MKIQTCYIKLHNQKHEKQNTFHHTVDENIFNIFLACEDKSKIQC